MNWPVFLVLPLVVLLPQPQLHYCVYPSTSSRSTSTTVFVASLRWSVAVVCHATVLPTATSPATIRSPSADAFGWSFLERKSCVKIGKNCVTATASFFPPHRVPVTPPPCASSASPLPPGPGCVPASSPGIASPSCRSGPAPAPTPRPSVVPVPDPYQCWGWCCSAFPSPRGSQPARSLTPHVWCVLSPIPCVSAPIAWCLFGSVM